jgi:hypothetical protein
MAARARYAVCQSADGPRPEQLCRKGVILVDFPSEATDFWMLPKTHSQSVSSRTRRSYRFTRYSTSDRPRRPRLFPRRLNTVRLHCRLLREGGICGITLGTPKTFAQLYGNY